MRLPAVYDWMPSNFAHTSQSENCVPELRMHNMQKNL